MEKRRAGGYVSLQSASQRGLYLGMKPDGRVWPTVDTGVNNVHLYPQVVECKEACSEGGGGVIDIKL